MKKTAVCLFLAMLAFSFCSKGKGGSTSEATKPEPRGGAKAASSAGAAPALGIKSVALSPEAPTVQDDIVAAVELSDPDREGVDLSYQWFINGQEVMDLEGSRMDRARFRKGAWIFCRAKATAAGMETDWFKSDVIRVQNSLPVLRLEPLGAIRVPGELRYQAAASDPDGDELTFEVLEPRDSGIEIDPRSGALLWRIDAATIQKFGEAITIQLAASDGEGQKVTGTIALQFTSRR